MTRLTKTLVTKTFVTETLAAALVAATIPLCVAPAAASPLSQSLALDNANIGAVEQVQYRRWNGRWIGPAAAGLAAGAIIGGALAPRYYDGYYAYGAAPGAYYAYGAAPGYVAVPRYRTWDQNYGNGSAATGPGSFGMCPADREDASGYPTWACR